MLHTVSTIVASYIKCSQPTEGQILNNLYRDGLVWCETINWSEHLTLENFLKHYFSSDESDEVLQVWYLKNIGRRKKCSTSSHSYIQ